MSAPGSIRIWTVGHSTRTFEEFAELLRGQGIRAVADVRRFPASRRLPQFNQQSLASSLSGVDIEYVHFVELGGRRSPRVDSPNMAWRNPAFRGYADYMMTSEFSAGMDRLLGLGRQKPAAIMCAEAVWWRCHRSLIADFLKAAGHEVIHILGPGKTQEHPYTSAAQIKDGKLTYNAGFLL